MEKLYTLLAGMYNSAATVGNSLAVSQKDKQNYHMTWNSSSRYIQKTHMQVRKQQLELDMEQQTGSK